MLLGSKHEALRHFYCLGAVTHLDAVHPNPRITPPPQLGAVTDGRGCIEMKTQ